MLTPLQKTILARRGIPEEAMEQFVAAKVADLHAPNQLCGMQAAGECVEEAIAKQARICVVGDFDADGITSTALLVMALRELGAQHVVWFINSRFEIGFGLQPATLEEIQKRHGSVDLIITVDNGIAAMEAVEQAREAGIRVVITDHHEPNEELPAADAIVNPKQETCNYPNKYLAGVGVAFKLVQHLFARREMPRRALLYLDLAALGTVADVMNLLDENRVIVKNGLTLMNWPKRRAGIAAMKQVFSIQGDVGVYHLGYCFGPLLNAQGRLEGVPDLAVELLMTRQPARALEIAETLYELNRERQEITRQQVEQTIETIGSQPGRCIVHYNAEIHEGIAGLIAGRVKENYFVPTLILTEDKKNPGYAKGSARSIPGFDMKRHLVDECADLLLKGGGHAMAAGVTLAIENIPAVLKRLKEATALYPDSLFVPTVEYDYTLPARELSLQVVEQIEALEPYGIGFPKPVLQMTDFSVAKTMYIKEQHVKLVSSDGLEVMAFGQADAWKKRGPTTSLNLIGAPGKNEWRNQVKVQFIVKNGSL